MSTPAGTRTPPTACGSCLRRSWLLSSLTASLDYQCRDRSRFFELLCLGDEDLVAALAGRRRDELIAAYARFRATDIQRADGIEAVCLHDRLYPPTMRDPRAPALLNVAGGAERLDALASAPTVAIVGSRNATDYGVAMAKYIARGLAASGVTVAAGLFDGIAVAAHAGALEADGRTVAVVAGGVDTGCPARRRSLYRRINRSGCAVSELPCGCAPRRWAEVASERVLASLAGLTVVVEAADSQRELTGARLAQALGRVVASVPGRVTSPASSGTHALLREGAHLVRGPQDALELLCGPETPERPAPTEEPVGLEPRLKAILELVGAGRDTPEKLDGVCDPGGLLLALSELELMGLLTRGDGGRYVPRCSSSTQPGG